MINWLYIWYIACKLINVFFFFFHFDLKLCFVFVENIKRILNNTAIIKLCTNKFQNITDVYKYIDMQYITAPN